MIILQLKLQNKLLYVVSDGIQHLFHNHLKVQLTRCMDFEAMLALTNDFFFFKLSDLLQANTGGSGNIFNWLVVSLFEQIYLTRSAIGDTISTVSMMRTAMWGKDIDICQCVCSIYMRSDRYIVWLSPA